MRRFRNILFVSERPEENAAFEKAVALAEENQASLMIVGTFGSLSHEIISHLPFKYPENLMDMLTQEWAECVDSLLKPLRQKGMDVQRKALVGTPFVQVIREVLKSGHDLVITSTDTARGLKDLFFRSTTMNLLRKCPCPVWVIKSTHGDPFSEIVAAIDPTHSDRQIVDLNDKIIEMASSLAELENSHLHVIHCWMQPLEAVLRGNPEVGWKLATDMIHETRQVHESLVDAFLDKHDLSAIDFDVHLLKGEPAIQIPQFIKENHVDLIVMGTICRTGVPGFFIGNTAEDILSQVECSVLTAKPEGFKTPVTL